MAKTIPKRKETPAVHLSSELGTVHVFRPKNSVTIVTDVDDIDVRDVASPVDLAYGAIVDNRASQASATETHSLKGSTIAAEPGRTVIGCQTGAESASMIRVEYRHVTRLNSTLWHRP